MFPLLFYNLFQSGNIVLFINFFKIKKFFLSKNVEFSLRFLVMSLETNLSFDAMVH